MFYWKLMSWKPAEVSLREAHQAENPNHLLLKHFLLRIKFSMESDSNTSRFKVCRAERAQEGADRWRHGPGALPARRGRVRMYSVLMMILFMPANTVTLITFQLYTTVDTNMCVWCAPTMHTHIVASKCTHIL